MPTYEYECEACGRVYDVRQRISAPPLTHCQFCNGPVHRLLAAAPFILKGGGWYVTDYPSESRKKAMEAEKKTAPAETAGSEKSAEGATKSAGGATKSAEGATNPTAKPTPTPGSSSSGSSSSSTD